MSRWGLGFPPDAISGPPLPGCDSEDALLMTATYFLLQRFPACSSGESRRPKRDKVSQSRNTPKRHPISARSGFRFAELGRGGLLADRLCSGRREEKADLLGNPQGMVGRLDHGALRRSCGVRVCRPAQWIAAIRHAYGQREITGAQLSGRHFHGVAGKRAPSFQIRPPNS